jgi:hypothetical protein
MNNTEPKIEARWRARRVANGLAILAAKQETKTKSWLPWHRRNARYYGAIYDHSFFIV